MPADTDIPVLSESVKDQAPLTPPAPTTYPDAVVAGARTAEACRIGYRMWQFDIADDHFVYTTKWAVSADTNDILFSAATEEECSQWIAERAFAAGLEAMWQPIETLPPFDQRPQRMFVRVEGWKEHSGSLWRREWRDVAFIRREDQPDSCLGYRRADMERMMRDADMDGIDRVTHWQPLPQPPRTTGDAA